MRAGRTGETYPAPRGQPPSGVAGAEAPAGLPRGIACSTRQAAPAAQPAHWRSRRAPAAVYPTTGDAPPAASSHRPRTFRCASSGGTRPHQPSRILLLRVERQAEVPHGVSGSAVRVGLVPPARAAPRGPRRAPSEEPLDLPAPLTAASRRAAVVRRCSSFDRAPAVPATDGFLSSAPLHVRTLAGEEERPGWTEFEAAENLLDLGAGAELERRHGPATFLLGLGDFRGLGLVWRWTWKMTRKSCRPADGLARGTAVAGSCSDGYEAEVCAKQGALTGRLTRSSSSGSCGLARISRGRRRSAWIAIALR